MMTQSRPGNTVPALDRTPTGRLPYTVATTQRLDAAAIVDQLVIEQAALSDGVPCMWADQGNKVRVAYDPKQITEPEAKAVVVLKVGAARRKQADTASIILQLEKNHAQNIRDGLGSPELDAFHNEVIRIVAEADDPKATFAEIVRLMGEHRAGAIA